MNLPPPVELQPTRRSEQADFRKAVLEGLARRPKHIPCKYLYDAIGSRLFETICELDEYYVTRTERGILERFAQDMAALCGPDCLLVELGSGSSTKTRLLLDRLEAPAAYVPIDIARAQLDTAAAQIREAYPWLEVLPVCSDYHEPIPLPEPARPHGRTIFFFPGSTIGNFEPDDACAFLSGLARGLPGPCGLLIGVDLQKPHAILQPAYNDSRGVTAQFNLNLLRRVNRELGGDFALNQFRHRAVYDPHRGRIEMHLVSTRRQAAHLDGIKIPFARNEFIVTEHSYKYTIDNFTRAAWNAGFEVQRLWTDPRRWFAMFFLHPEPLH